jgi:putative glycosyltransferase (TIGR04348 family)
MKIGIITPAPPGSRYGNRVTAIRWMRILKKLGHRVVISQSYTNQQFDLLIALHARRSFDSINRFHRDCPDHPVIVALTGTDLYRDLGRNNQANRSLDIATRIVVLQPRALGELRPAWRRKTRVVYQSVARPGQKSRRLSRERFDVCVVGHLRRVKDPFRAARAARFLPESSRIRVIQIGGALTSFDAGRARREMRSNPRYKWFGEVAPARVWKVLSKSHLFVISSLMEGGANALGEAIVAGLPVLASRIEGSLGILGDDYPGYFRAGDSRQLARLLILCESDPRFLAELTRRCRALVPLFSPAREEASWRQLVDELAP